MTFPRPLKIFLGVAVVAGGAIFVTLPEDVPVGSRFALSTPAVYDSLKAAGWDISAEPLYSDDSTMALWDRDGNIPFSDEEFSVLASLDVLVLAESGVKEYIYSHGFSEPVRHP